MRFRALQNKRIVWLSLCFATFWFGFNGAEQFFAVYYNQTGAANMALMALAIIYAAVIPASFVAPLVVGRLGLKRSIILPGIIYAVFVFGVIGKNPLTIYALAALLGLLAAPLGVARGTYLLKCAEDDEDISYGEALGAQDSIRSIGSTLGVLSVGFASRFLSLDAIFVVLGLVILLALGLFTRSEPLEREAKRVPLRRIGDVVRRRAFWLAAPLFFATNFMLGISISTIPLALSLYGLGTVGLVTSIFSFGPIFLSITMGKVSDLNSGCYRRLVLLAALLGGVAAASILLTTNSLWWIAMATLLVTALFSAGNSAGGGLVGEMFPEGEWETAQGLLGAVGTLGVVAPLISEQILPREQTLHLVILTCFVAFIGLLLLQRRSD